MEIEFLTGRLDAISRADWALHVKYTQIHPSTYFDLSELVIIITHA